MADLDTSLVKITKGTSITLLGTGLGLAFGFLAKNVLVARIYGGSSSDEYGVFSMAIVVLQVCCIVAALGLQQGVSRSIAYARARGEAQRVERLIPASIQLGFSASVLLSVVMFMSSNIIASRFFQDSAYAFPLRVMAIGIPFLTMSYVLISVFRGFDDVKPKVFFEDLLPNILFTVLLLPIIFLGLHHDGIVYSFLVTLIITSVLCAGYSMRRMPDHSSVFSITAIRQERRDLLAFSLPLMGVNMLLLIIMWTDVMMLGIMKTPTEVGLYNAAHPLGVFVSTPMNVMLIIYLPIATGQYARHDMAALRSNFTILTKWICIGTLPLFLILFLFPTTVLTFLFGSAYGEAADALRFLALGFMLNNALGPNMATLVALGETRFMMLASLLMAMMNIVLNLVLVPSLGIEGAAIASAISISSGALVRAWRVRSRIRTQPLSGNMVKPLAVLLAFALPVSLLMIHYTSIVWWMLPLFFLFYYAVYGMAILLTRSLDPEDAAMMCAISRKVGINDAPLRRILQRYL